MWARRGRQLALLGGVVLLAHLWLANRALPDRIGDGAADTRPTRMSAAFVRQLTPSAALPIAAAPVTRVAARARVPERPASAAAREPLPESPTVPATLALPEAPLPMPALSELPAAAASASTSASAASTTSMPQTVDAAASAPVQAFEWPPSTRLSYRLNGNYRGPVEGQATVEWLRSGSRYQVFMDLGIGPSFAPLMSRRVSSEGEVTDQGLRPRRYDEETKVLLLEPRRLRIDMDGESVKLTNGERTPQPPGLQDSASQFVHLTWLFTTHPELLQPGRSVDIPLALPRVVETWTYDILGTETLSTPAGPVQAVHIKPRREPKPGAVLTAEIWIAPSLQYLPVRILIRQDSDTFIDLTISRLPEQAAQGR